MAPPILNLGIDGGGWSHHASITLPLGGGTSSIHWIGGWVGPRAGLDAVAELRKIFSAPFGNRTPVVQAVI
jgi:hypothetical protein